MSRHRKGKIITILFLFLIMIIDNAYAQKIIEGRITDAKSMTPIPGVQIRVKGTTVTAITNVMGGYKIALPKGINTLEFTSHRYITQIITVGHGTELDVQLKKDLLGIDREIHVGYTKIKKYNVSTAINDQIDEEFINFNAVTIDQYLQGKAPGVSVVRSSGRPGAPVSINIRGLENFGANEPLIIVDDFPITNDAGNEQAMLFNPLLSINPADIESVEILKDGASTAMYGVRGANGVILLTTKKGNPGETKISFSSSFGINLMQKKLDLLDTQGYIELLNQQKYSDDEEVISILDEHYDNVSPWISNDTDWQDEMTRGGGVQNYYISITGGGDKSRFLFSAGYHDEKGHLHGAGLKRYSARANSEFIMGQRIKLGQSFTISRSDMNVGGESETYLPYNVTTKTPPMMPVYDSENVGGYAGSDETTVPGTAVNPRGIAELITDNKILSSALGTAYAEIFLFRNFSYRLNISADLTNVDSYKLSPVYDMGNQSNSLPDLVEGYVRNKTWSAENLFKYENIFGRYNEHELYIHGGYSAYKYSTKNSSTTITDYTVQSNLIADDSGTKTISRDESGFSMASIFARLIYSYKNKYHFTASTRRDGSSKFASSNRWSLYPAVSAGWSISEEKFMSRLPSVNLLKIRASWGKTGTHNSPDYGSIQLISTENVAAIGNPSETRTVISLENLANKNLKAETTSQANVGFDLIFYNNQAVVNLDVYKSKSTDVLTPMYAPLYSGLEYPVYTNNGEISNMGIDLSLCFRKPKRYDDDYHYSVTANVSYLKNEITSLSSTVYGTKDYGILQQGGKVGDFYGFVVDGIFQNTDEIDKYNTYNTGYEYQAYAEPGDIRFKDIAGSTDDETSAKIVDGTIDDRDQTVTGNSYPMLMFGLNTNASYLGFDLTINITGVYGNEIFNQHRRELEGMSELHNHLSTVSNCWVVEGTSTDMPRATCNDLNDNERISDRWIESGTYVRLQVVQLGYTLRGNLSKYYGISRVRFYLSAQNIYTFTNYKGIDPEIGTRYSVSEEGYPTFDYGVDYGYCPKPRSFFVGLQVDF